ncbi:PH domain-containing protein [Bacillus fonticola]|uniref:PH domain-containing protein n=1 Tax=Bacillus fonticola TaxID=2728853 RepID=UPI0014727C1B|nr:PH domain-containing protein [Bacillus fonticola]
MFKRKRQHPIALVSEVLVAVREGIIPLLLLFFAGRTENLLSSFIVPSIALFVLASLGFVKWWRFVYWVEDDELRVESGLFVRQKRYIPFERIQSTDITEGVIQRLFKRVKFSFETGGSSSEKKSAEATINALTRDEAQEMQSYIAKRKQALEYGEDNEQEEDFDSEDVYFPKVYEAPKEEKLYEMPWHHILIMAATSGSIGIILTAVIAFGTQFIDVLPFEEVFSDVENAVSTNLLMLVLMISLALAVMWIVGTAFLFVKYGKFTVWKTEKEFILTKGLVEKKRLTIPLHRIQAIRVVRSPLRQVLGFATVRLDSAGGSSNDVSGTGILLFPLIPTKGVQVQLEKIFHDYSIPDRDLWVRAPKRAWWRIVRGTTIGTFLIAFIFVWWVEWYTWTISILTILTLLWGRWIWKSAGLAIKDDQLALRYRFFSETTLLVRKHRIQSIKVSQSIFQKRLKVQNIEVSLKSGEGSKVGLVSDYEVSDIATVYSWFQRK